MAWAKYIQHYGAQGLKGAKTALMDFGASCIKARAHWKSVGGSLRMYWDRCLDPASIAFGRSSSRLLLSFMLDNPSSSITLSL